MKILAAKVLKPHGLQGVLKVEVYLDNWDFYKNNIMDHNNNLLSIMESTMFNKKLGYWLIKLNKVNNLQLAHNYIGNQWFIDSEQLIPEQQNHFYYYKLIGLPVKDQEDNCLGVVENVSTIGGGDVLIIKLNIGTEVYLPFDTYTFPEVNEDFIRLSNNGLDLIFKKK